MRTSTKHPYPMSWLTGLDVVTIILVTMEARQPFTIVYAPITRLHLRAIPASYYALIHMTIEECLSYEPDVTTRNRFRGFYDLDQKQHVVAILAIGIKRGSRLLIGGEEIRL